MKEWELQHQYPHLPSIIHSHVHRLPKKTTWLQVFICCAVFSGSVVLDSATPWSAACQAPRSMGILQARTLEWIAMPSSRDLPNPGIKPRSPTLQVNSWPSEPPGKPMNTGVGSLSVLQEIFLTQESNWGLLRFWPAGLPGKPVSLHIKHQFLLL